MLSEFSDTRSENRSKKTNIKRRVINITDLKKLENLNGDDIAALIQRTNMIKKNLPFVKINSIKQGVKKDYSFPEINSTFVHLESITPNVKYENIYTGRHLIGNFFGEQFSSSYYKSNLEEILNTEASFADIFFTEGSWYMSFPTAISYYFRIIVVDDANNESVNNWASLFSSNYGYAIIFPCSVETREKISDSRLEKELKILLEILN